MGIFIKVDSRASRSRVTDTFFVLRRYVERNTLAAGLVSNAEQWLFGSDVIGLAEVVELSWQVGHRQGCPIG